MKANTERWQEVSSSAHRRQETIRPPGPVTDDWIDETRDSNAIQKISNETRATDHRSRGNGGAGIGKRELEKPESEEGDAGRLVSCWNTTQEEPVIADESITVAEHECEADCI